MLVEGIFEVDILIHSDKTVKTVKVFSLLFY
jgi:hypothetical protein